jgi:hypothetical protein
MIVKHVEPVIIPDFENIGSNLHAASIALAAIVIDLDLRRRFSSFYWLIVS